MVKGFWSRFWPHDGQNDFAFTETIIRSKFSYAKLLLESFLCFCFQLNLTLEEDLFGYILLVIALHPAISSL
jgi:hypothetical protein